MTETSIPAYDDNNIFACILRGEIPCRKAFENEWVLAFHDISPKAPLHLLVIPKKPYVSFADFSAKASSEEIEGFTRAIGQIATEFGVVASGYRLVTNAGPDSGQEVPRYIVYVLAGRALNVSFG